MRNYRLGRMVVDKATLEPEHFDMSDWVTGDQGCGMTACLGGWTMLLAGYTTSGHSFWRPDGSLVRGGYADEAARLLGMTEDERYQRDPYQQVNFLPEVFFDADHGLERFIARVEASEREAAIAAAAGAWAGFHVLPQDVHGNLLPGFVGRVEDEL